MFFPSSPSPIYLCIYIYFFNYYSIYNIKIVYSCTYAPIAWATKIKAVKSLAAR